MWTWHLMHLRSKGSPIAPLCRFMAEGVSCIRNPLISGDTDITIRAIGTIWVCIRNRKETGCELPVAHPAPKCFPGQVIRHEEFRFEHETPPFCCALCHNRLSLRVARMKERPIGPLVDALKQPGREGSRPGKRPGSRL